MAHGITLILKDIQPAPSFTTCAQWKALHGQRLLWNGTGIRPAISYRGARRNLWRLANRT